MLKGHYVSNFQKVWGENTYVNTWTEKIKQMELNVKSG